MSDETEQNRDNMIEIERIATEIAANVVEMGKISGKQEMIHKDIRDVKALLLLQNGRIRRLENWRNLITGGLAVSAVVLGYIIRLVS